MSVPVLNRAHHEHIRAPPQEHSDEMPLLRQEVITSLLRFLPFLRSDHLSMNSQGQGSENFGFLEHLPV